MKPLGEYDEQELQQASDEELAYLLTEYLRLSLLVERREWYLTGDGMLEVLEAMKPHSSHGLRYCLQETLENGITGNEEVIKTAFFYYQKPNGREAIAHASHPTSLPRAVAVAALLAMKEKECRK